MGHIVAHDQLSHEHYRRGKVELRQLLELAIIRKKHENAIDWMELDRRFSGVVLGKVLATYLELANKLFGQARPRLRHAARVGALAELRWRIDPSGWTPWGPTFSDWNAGRQDCSACARRYAFDASRVRLFVAVRSEFSDRRRSAFA